MDPIWSDSFGLLKIAAYRFSLLFIRDAGGRQQECARHREEIVFL
jgi:hypothetical protein